MSNIIGLINQFGANHFNRIEPLELNRIPVVKVSENYYKEEFVQKTKSDIIPEIDKLLFIYDNYLPLNPITGKHYNELIKNVSDLFYEYCDFVYDDIVNKKYIYSTIPIGLITVEDPINLCFLGNIEQNDFNFIQDQIFPFELSVDIVYMVINVEKSEDNLCIDRSFTTITLMDGENNSFKTYIRITDENDRWSDWLEYKDDISININILKVLCSMAELNEFFKKQFLPTNEYECMNISYNILYDNNIFYNNKNEYECKINLFKINQIFSLSSYLIFLKSLLHNITYTPKEDKLSFTYKK